MVNPVFMSWRIYPVGTTTVLSTRKGDAEEIREVTKLLEKKEHTITLSVEKNRLDQGKIIETKHHTVTLSYLVPKTGSAGARNLDATPLTLQVLGKSYASFFSQSSGTDSNGTFVTRRWDSDTIPGLLVLLEKETTPPGGGAAQFAITELLELNFPKWDAK